MAIVKQPAPKDGGVVLSEALGHLMPQRAEGSGAFALARAAEAAPGVTQPLKLFTVHLRDIKDETFARKAKPIGWRYLVVDGAPLAVADVKRRSQAEGSAFAGLIHGPLAGDIGRACALAEKTFAKDRRKFEPRVIEIPALSMVALWLHAGAKGDAFIPLLTGGGKIRIDRRFAANAVEAAKARQAFLAEPAPTPRKLGRKKAKPRARR